MDVCMRKQIPLFVFSGVIAVLMLSAGGASGWFWILWAVIVFAQIGKGLGWDQVR